MMALFFKKIICLHKGNTSAYLQTHVRHATHRSCSLETSQYAAVCGRRKGSRGGEGRKVKRSLFSTSENELKLFLVPAAAYNGKNEDWSLPKKWAVRNNRCEISATSLARSVSQTALRARVPVELQHSQRHICFFFFLLLNCCFSCLAEFTRQPHPSIQLMGNIHVLTSMCTASYTPQSKLVTTFSKITLIFHVSLLQFCSPLFLFHGNLW